jgi:hypothetical protein
VKSKPLVKKIELYTTNFGMVVTPQSKWHAVRPTPKNLISSTASVCVTVPLIISIDETVQQLTTAGKRISRNRLRGACGRPCEVIHVAFGRQHCPTKKQRERHMHQTQLSEPTTCTFLSSKVIESIPCKKYTCR